MAKSELKFRCFIEIDGADAVPMESLTPQEKERVMGIWSERLSRNMSAWYSQHPELLGELV